MERRAGLEPATRGLITEYRCTDLKTFRNGQIHPHDGCPRQVLGYIKLEARLLLLSASSCIFHNR